MSKLAVKETGDGRFDSKRASDVSRAAWMMREAKEIEVRHHFQHVPLTEGLETLAQARKMVEIAAFELNQRIEDSQRAVRCTTCNRTLEPGKLWAMQTTERDPDTGLTYHVQYCNALCVRERNRKKLMPAGADPIAADGREMGDIR